MSSNEPDGIDDINQADQVEHIQVDYSHITLLACVLKQINLGGSYLLQSILKYKQKSYYAVEGYTYHFIRINFLD